MFIIETLVTFVQQLINQLVVLPLDDPLNWAYNILNTLLLFWAGGATG